MSDLAQSRTMAVSYDSCHDSAASALRRLACRRLSLPRGSHAGESGTASATAGSPCQTTAAATGVCRQGVLGRSPQAVVWVEETAPARHPRNGGALASHGLPLVLVLAVADSTRRRKETLESGSARADFPHGRRESDVGMEQSTMLR